MRARRRLRAQVPACAGMTEKKRERAEFERRQAGLALTAASAGMTEV